MLETTSKKVRLNKNIYFTIYSCINEGLSPVDICARLNTTKQALNPYIRHLKANGYIQKIGYKVWKTSKYFDFNTLINTSKEIRTHAFILTLVLPKIDNWKNREEFFKKKNIQYKKFNNRNMQKLLFKNYKIQIGNKAIVVYQPKWKSYFVNSAKTGKNYVIYDFLQLIVGLERLLGISLKINKNYKFKVDRQHHALIHNELAKQYAKDNRKLEIRDEKGCWLVFDNSDFDNVKLEELETQGKTADFNMDMVVSPFFNSLKRNPITVDDVLNMIGDVTKNQQKHQESMVYLDKNLQTHFEVLEGIKKEINKLNKTIKEIKK